MRANGAVQWLGKAEEMTQGVPSVSFKSLIHTIVFINSFKLQNIKLALFTNQRSCWPENVDVRLAEVV